ncbi:MAG: hypothetical protein ISS47_07490 [Candidatus Omnitrophica bacterium]|nr:hypothetical protein [Candidatus Omnitrophota bacterium]
MFNVANYYFNPQSVPLFFVGIIMLSSGIFVYYKNKSSNINKSFLLICVSVSIWLIATAFGYISKVPGVAKIWFKIDNFSVLFISISVYSFVVSLLDLNRSLIVRSGYLISFILGVFVVATDFLIIGVKKYFWGYFPLWGYLSIPFLIFFFGFMLISFIELLSHYLITRSPIKKNQIKYIFIAFLGAYIGLVDFLPTFGIEIYPFGYVTIAFFLSVVAYSIVKHQLMEIEVIIKKTLVFASLFALVFGIFIGITLLTQELIAGGRLLGLAISSIIIIFSVRPLEDFLIRITDKYLFQKKYDYKQVLKSFIDEVITVLNLDKIIQSTIGLLDKTLHPKTSAILLLNRYEDKYISYETSGYNREITLENSSKIVILLKTTKDIFSVEKSENPIEATEELKYEMNNLNARLAIPLMLHNDLIGILLLGKKKSDEEYAKEDLDILTDLARTEAVAIGNAQLFAEAAQNERRAAIGTLAAGINHEVGNPLNIINTKMQVYLMSIERGLYKDKKPEDIIRESKEIMSTCLQQTSRISDITKKLSNFARPSKAFRPELTDVEEQINETLSVIGHELELERIEIKRDIQKSLPKILADKRQIQQIFFNIIKNAAQAITEKGSIEIKAYSSQDGDVKNVKIEISDTGQGISEDKLERIYEPFFTTKEPSKGTGLGLAIVRQLVWCNRGDIKVKSKIGSGTTFTLTFPEAR